MKKLLLLMILIVCVSINNSWSQSRLSEVQRGEREGLQFGFLTPTNYDSTQSYPIIVSLHPYGLPVYENSKWYLYTEYQAANPCFIFTPLCPPEFGSWGTNSDTAFTTPIRLALEVLDSLIAEFPIDTNRLYIHGKSMGGLGTINVISKQPGRFAAAYSECGGGYPSTAPECSQTPLWLFHGNVDESVPVEASRGLYNAIIEYGGTNVRYTEFDGAGHEISYRVNNTPGLNAWIFAQDKSVAHGEPDAALDFSVTQLDNWTVSMNWTGPDQSLKNDNRVWYYEILRDGISIDTMLLGETSFVDSNLVENQPYVYKIRTTNYFFNSSLSDSIVFSTAVDVTPPEVVTSDVYQTGPDETKIMITFNEKMSELSCENPANYTISGGVQILSAELQSDKHNVLLTTSPLNINAEYDITIANVEDSALAKNKIADGTQVQIVYREWLTANIGTWLNPGTVILDDNSVTLTIEGEYTNPNFSENILFVNKTVAGACTLSTRISQTASDRVFRAGIMLRNSLEPGSLCFALSAAGTRLHLTNRTNRNFNDESIRGITFPLYIRIIRADGSFSVYSSVDGTNWGNPLKTVTDNLDSTVYVGLFATPLNEGNISATFDNIGFPIITSVSDEVVITPLDYSLSQNYPNPFNPSTVISYSIPDDASVKVEVYDMLCQKVVTLVDRIENRGTHNITWNAGNLSSGIYYIRLIAESINPGQRFEKTLKALLLK
ncbi:MAG: prolyl oligopeptidase family serine peptidase [Ignavibacteriaceae bacterium]